MFAIAAKMNIDNARRTLIVGLGMTGLSVARYLHARGEVFTVIDSRAEPPQRQALRTIDPDAPVLVGEFDPALFADAARLIVSPGVPVRHPAIAAARANGVEVIGDIELFAREVKAPIVAITGSNGKSTVTTLFAAMARQAGYRVVAGGNLGPPALDLLARPAPDVYVLELSSFQLETTVSLAPAAAAVLNLSADHLDRYESLENYAAAKARIFNGAQIEVINRDDSNVAAMAAASRCISFGLNAPADGHYGLRRDRGRTWLSRGSTPVLAEDELQIRGRHNTANALAALALGEALGETMGLPPEPMARVLRSFTGLPHRCQRIAERRRVTWYNDSKATNVGATLAALAGLPGKIVLIAGGEGKGQDFSPLRAALTGKGRAAVLFGRDAGIIAEAIEGSVPTVRAADLRTAVNEAARLAQPGDGVLLAPACASFDMFRDYAHRGEVFTAAVREALA